MIFILKESFYNGTVTICTNVSGIEADDFEGAKAKIKALPKFPTFAQDVKEDSDSLSYYIPGQMPGYGVMDSSPLHMIDFSGA